MQVTDLHTAYRGNLLETDTAKPRRRAVVLRQGCFGSMAHCSLRGLEQIVVEQNNQKLTWYKHQIVKEIQLNLHNKKEEMFYAGDRFAYRIPEKPTGAP